MSRAVFTSQRQAVRPGVSLPGLAARSFRRLSPPGRRRGPDTLPPARRRGPTGAMSDGELTAAIRAVCWPPARSMAKAIAEGLGTVATLRNPDLVAAGASVDAREWICWRLEGSARAAWAEEP